MSNTKSISTRLAFGQTLVKLANEFPEMLVLDAEMSNSTFTSLFAKEFPTRFLQNFIAEQNMISTALGLSLSGKLPVCATFAAFLTRAFDQIRMSQYTAPKANLKIVGSHCGVSIGTDGPSQMALEDLSLFGSILEGVILYPSTGIATAKLTQEMLKTHGITYLRLTRDDTEEIYQNEDGFVIGGSKTLLKTENDEITLIGAGITIFESLKAVEIIKQETQNKTQDETQNLPILESNLRVKNSENSVLDNLQNLQKSETEKLENPTNLSTNPDKKTYSKISKIPNIRVIDLYSVKPFDKETVLRAARETKAIIVVEDHFAFGGIFANLSAFLATQNPTTLPRIFHPNWQGIYSLAVTEIPRSGQKAELLTWAKIDAKAIVNKIEEILNVI